MRVVARNLQGTSYLDGLGRSRETQSTSPNGTGRIVTTIRYDSSSNNTGTSAPFYNSSAAGSGMVNPEVSTLPSYTDPIHDWAGRVIETRILANGTIQPDRRTYTTYYGDYTRVTPAVGGTTDTYTDVYGNTTKIVQNLPMSRVKNLAQDSLAKGWVFWILGLGLSAGLR